MKAVNCLLRRLRKKDDIWNSAIAGIASSFGLLMENADRRVTLGLYLMTRTLQYGCRLLLDKNIISNFPQADVLLMCLANWGVIWGFLMHPECLPHSFLYFITHHGGYTRYGKYWYDFMQIAPSLISKKDNVYIDATKFYDISSEPIAGYEPCRFIHPSTKSCTLGSILYFAESLPRSLKLYIPFNLAVTLLFKRNFSSPRKMLFDYFISCTKSSLFLTLYSWITKTSICIFNDIGLNWLNIAGFPGFMCGLSVLAERKERRIELALYCLPRGIQIVWNILRKKRKIPHIPYGEFIFLSLTFGTLFSIYQWESSSINRHHLSLLRQLLDVN